MLTNLNSGSLNCKSSAQIDRPCCLLLLDMFVLHRCQHKPYTDRSSCSKTCFHVSIIECPFTLNPWQSLNSSVFSKQERDGRYFHTLYKQRVRKLRTRTSACIKNLLTCKILTMVIPNVCLFVFCVFAPFSRRKFIHRLRPVFFQLCYGRSLHQG